MCFTSVSCFFNLTALFDCDMLLFFKRGFKLQNETLYQGLDYIITHLQTKINIYIQYISTLSYTSQMCKIKQMYILL